MLFSKHQFLARFSTFLSDDEWQAVEDASDEARTEYEWFAVARR